MLTGLDEDVLVVDEDVLDVLEDVLDELITFSARYGFSRSLFPSTIST